MAPDDYIMNSLVNTAWIDMIGESETIIYARAISTHTSLVDVITFCTINDKKL